MSEFSDSDQDGSRPTSAMSVCSDQPTPQASDRPGLVHSSNRPTGSAGAGPSGAGPSGAGPSNRAPAPPRGRERQADRERLANEGAATRIAMYMADESLRMWLLVDYFLSHPLVQAFLLSNRCSYGDETKMRRYQPINYRYTSEKCSRTKCVLCARTSTERVLVFKPEAIHIACCSACVYMMDHVKPLTAQQKTLMEERIEKKVKHPIAYDFNEGTGIRTFKETMTTLFTTPTSYNRYGVVPRKRNVRKNSNSENQAPPATRQRNNKTTNNKRNKIKSPEIIEDEDDNSCDEPEPKKKKNVDDQTECLRTVLQRLDVKK